jgi:phasin family protein
MFAQVMNGFVEQSKVWFEPAFEFNRIALNQLQKLGQKQLAMTNDYAGIGLEQLQKASQLQQLDEVTKLAEEQLKTSADVSRKVMEDAQSWVTLGQEMSNEWQQFMASQMAVFMPESKQAKATKSK